MAHERCRATCPSASSHTQRARRALRLPRRRARQEGQGAPQPRAAREAGRGGRSTAPYHKFNLGSEYLAAGRLSRKALRRFSRVRGTRWRTSRSRTNFPYMPSLASRTVIALRELRPPRRGAPPGRRRPRGVPRLHRPRLPPGRHRQATRGDLDAARRLFERCLEMGDAPSALLRHGRLWLLPRAAQRAGCTARGDRSSEQVNCSRAASTSTRPSRPGAAARDRDARRPAATPDEVVDAIESRVEKITATVRFMLGTALYEAGATGRGRGQFRAVLEQQPGPRHARVALAEAVLLASALRRGGRRGRRGCRGRAVRRRRAPHPALRPARRGRGRRRRAALERARADLRRRRRRDSSRRGSPPRAGEPLPARLPREAAPLLTATLEALLRVRRRSTPSACSSRSSTASACRCATAASCSPRCTSAAASSTRPPRSGSAWCQDSGPDAGAMLGLALVAAAREMPEDALVFAREARELDPENAARCSS